MRHFQVWTLVAAMGWATSTAWGQGLYGAPEMIRLAPPGMEATQQFASAPPAEYTAAAAGYVGAPAGATYAQANPYAQPYPYNQTYPNTQAIPQGVPPPYTAAPGAGYYGGNYGPAYANRMAAASPSGPALVPNAVAPYTEPGAAMPIRPTPQQPPNLVNQMLEESGRGVYGNGACGYGMNGNGTCGVGGMNGGVGWGGGATCQQGGPGFGAAGSGAFQPLWYVSAAGLFLTRNKANGVFTTYETNNNANQLMQTTDCEGGWGGGYEVLFGRRFGCNGCWAVEGDYWALDRLSGHTEMSLLPGNTVSTPLIVDGIEFRNADGTYTNGTYFFDNAAEHDLWRENRIQSIELNLVRWFGAGPYACGGDCGNPCATGYGGNCATGGCSPCANSCSPFALGVMLGPRYFVFDEELTFGTLANGGTWGGNGHLDEAYLSDHVINTLLGVQLGFNAAYRVTGGFWLFVIPKMGIYNNHIVGRVDLFRGDGVQANPTPESGVVGTFPVFADKDVFSFLGQIDVGLQWQFYRGWSAFAGYRLLAATGIALADHQIPTYIVDIPAWQNPKHNGDLIVHGGFAGLMYCF